MDYDPTLPPRWNREASPAPLVVYLDQWCYAHLAHDRAGNPQIPDEAGCFDHFRQLALDAKVVFALSPVNYYENSTREHEDGRWDTAVTMAELTGFNTMNLSGLNLWDALVGTATYLGMNSAIPRPEVFGWGRAHCFTGREVRAEVVDTLTGQRLTGDGLPEGTEQRMADRVELAALARRDPRLEPGMPAFAAVPDDGKGDRLVQNEHSIRAMIDEKDRTPSRVRGLVEGLCYADPTTMTHIIEACLVLGLAPDAIATDIGKYLDDQEYTAAVSAFLACMPIQGRFSELRVQAHLQPNRTLKSSDARDYLAIAAISPFVDYLVTDKGMFSLAMAGRLNERKGATVMRRLAGLRQSLDLELAARQ